MDFFGKYERKEKIGEGSFSIVYRAVHHLLGTEAALKILKKEYLRDDITRSRMKQEAQTAAGLEHPHIVEIFDWIEEGDDLGIAMEYIEGGNLADWIKRKKPPIDEILDVLLQVAGALDYIHARHLVHRDVKPQNILIKMNASEGSPQAKLSDFGLALDKELSLRLTQAQSIPGTAYYISPEQVEKLPLDGRSDQYSLGVVAYECLVGSPPFEGKDPIAVATKRLDEDVMPPSKANPDLPEEMDAPLLQSLQRLPEDRYETCSAFLRALREAWQESRLRRARELIQEAKNLARKGAFEEAFKKLESAKSLASSDERLKEAYKDIDSQLALSRKYEEGVRAWRMAKQKAETVVDLVPEFKDTKGILTILGARPKEKEPLDVKDWSQKIGVGILVALPFAAVLLYFLLLWIVSG